MVDQDLHKVAFPTLDDVQVATLAKFGTRRALRDGEHLFKAGDREYKFFVVERGAVEIVEHSSGETKKVALHERHAFGGDVSLVTGRPALISAVARGDTEVFEIATHRRLGRDDALRLEQLHELGLARDRLVFQHAQDPVLPLGLSERRHQWLAPTRSTSSERAECIRLPACCHTTDCGPSMTSAATSSPRCAGRQCMKIAGSLAAFISAASIVQPAKARSRFSRSLSCPIDVHTSV